MRENDTTGHAMSTPPRTAVDRVVDVIAKAAGKDALKEAHLFKLQGDALIQNFANLAGLDEEIRHQMHLLLEQNASAGQRKVLAKMPTRPDSVDAALASLDDTKAKDKADAKRQAKAEKVRKARLIIEEAEAENTEGKSASTGKNASGDT